MPNNIKKSGFSNGVKAIGLISGGLDSILAVKIVAEQGIKVIGVTFITPFNDDDFGKRAVLLAEQLDINCKLIHISEEFLDMLKSPRYGYGKNLNPCIDCRILEFKKAHQLMRELGASFIITGEVLGQRPMSQNKNSLELIEKKSGAEGLIVRPLCGKLLSPTTAERRGWIDRNKLFDINGRSRKKQYALAKQFNISGYSSPAGGCLLTDPGFSLITKNLLRSDMLDIGSIGLIKTGRYFTISDSFKLVVGRDEKENLKLMGLARSEDVIFQPQTKGPVAIGMGKRENENLQMACRIVAYYCKSPHPYIGGGGKDTRVSIKISYDGKEKIITCTRISESELSKYRV
ncbi:MAG: tRNA 4-thiouridine(8) synthase ThiI [Candidatus Ratteibacteria bacterium]|nr:tRNA 4-thiouridine(8) synthase ThiI [Candidatus Ratteibacteria bacterium]